jgi:hypothetical protein
MQAASHLLRRLMHAATHDDVPELKRLHQLGTATYNDYRMTFACAIKQESIASVIYLCASIKGVFDKSDCAGLTWLVLGSPYDKWILQLARQAPKYLVSMFEDAMESPDRLLYDERVYLNLLALFQDHSIQYSNSTRSKLVGTLLLTTMTLASNYDYWYGVYDIIAKLVEVVECGIIILIIDKHYLLAACLAIDRGANDSKGGEGRAVLQLLLDRSTPGIDGDNLIHDYCKLTERGAAMPMLLEHFKIDDVDGSYTRLISIRCSCVILEACLDRICATMDATLCDALLVDMAKNPNTMHGSRSLAHILERLLRNASDSAVYLALQSTHERRSRFETNSYIATISPHAAMHLFLVEHLIQRRGCASFIIGLDEYCLTWMLQRNPNPIAIRKLLPYMSYHQTHWMHAFLSRQAPIHAALLAHTPLATDLVDLAMQYV